ncbi:MAG: DUF4276 family protein [candidate division KSB1 bacterium]
MKVIIYVEGPSDKAALTALLAPLLSLKQQQGVAINFFEAPPGNKKESVLIKVPAKAANILLNDPQTLVIALPDLYPRNIGFQHETVEELVAGVYKNLATALSSKGAKDDIRLKDRFKVFCLKHDLEALLLAALEPLKQRLGLKELEPSWRIPVEEQNHDHPPKEIVEELFKKHGQRYQGTVDAPMILGTASHQEIADACPQCFKPFVDFLAQVS